MESQVDHAPSQDVAACGTGAACSRRVRRSAVEQVRGRSRNFPRCVCGASREPVPESSRICPARSGQ